MINKNYKFILFALFSNLFFERSFFIIYLKYIGISLYEIAILQSSINLFMFIFEVPTGILSDRIGRKKIIFIGIFLISIYFILMLLSQNFWLILLAFILFGTGLACVSGADQALIYSTLEKQKQANFYHKFISVYNASALAALALSSFFGGILAEMNLWHLVFLFGFVAQTISLVIIMNIKDVFEKTQTSLAPNSPQKKCFQTIKIRISALNKTAVAFIFSIAIFQSAFSTIVIFYQDVLASVGVSLYNIGIVFSFSLIISLCASLASGMISHFVTENKMIKFSLIVLIIGYLIFIIYEPTTGVYFILLLLLSNFLYEIIDTCLNVLFHHHIHEEYRSSILSTANAFTAILMVLFSLLIGSLSDYFDLTHILLYIALVSLIFVSITTTVLFQKKIKTR